MSVSRGSNNARVSIFIVALFSIVASYHPVSTFNLHRGPPPQPWSKSRPLYSSSSTSSSSLERTIEGDDPHSQLLLEHNDTNNNSNDNEQLRRIPFEQRVTQPRLARRMNHPFKYLFRHGFDETVNLHGSSNNNHNNDTTLDMEDPYTFLHAFGNYSHEQIQQMNASFPMLLQLSVRQQLYPKLLFLKYTILQQPQQSRVDPAIMSALVPPHYFGARLERIMAPRHAFLVWTRQLPCGVELLSPVVVCTTTTVTTTTTNPPCSLDHATTTIHHPVRSDVRYKFHEFLLSCRNSKQFAATCQKWSLESGHSATTTRDRTATTTKVNITAKDIEAFDMIFGRGLLSICRNDLVQDNNTWAIDQLQQNYKVRAADLVPILIGHGSNVYERDHRGATLLHWACGTGHIDIVQQLVPYFDVTNTTTTRDGATVLHWSAAGCNTREFGIGGHVHLCEYLIDSVRTSSSSSSSSSSSLTVHKFINQCTYDGNSPLMWAAWSGTLDTVKLLVRNKADTTLRNRNGCSVAHWAASGGNIEVCRYLHSIANVDFTVTNYGGNSPLSHAVAFGRTNVVEWLLQIINVQNQDKMLLYTLAQDFVQWTDGEEKQRRSELLQQLVDIVR